MKPKNRSSIPVQCYCPILRGKGNYPVFMCHKNTPKGAGNYVKHGLQYPFDLKEHDPYMPKHKPGFCACLCTDSVNTPCADSCLSGAEMCWLQREHPDLEREIYKLSWDYRILAGIRKRLTNLLEVKLQALTELCIEARRLYKASHPPAVTEVCKEP